jgi:hypothetical protein
VVQVAAVALDIRKVVLAAAGIRQDSRDGVIPRRLVETAAVQERLLLAVQAVQAGRLRMERQVHR